MFSHQLNTDFMAADTAAYSKFRKSIEEGRQAVLDRKSFPSPDSNRYIDAFLKEQRKIRSGK